MNVLKALSLIKSTPAVVMELVTGLGEVWSAQTLLAYLKTKNVPCEWIDARQIRENSLIIFAFF
jgi:aspartokinase/homoserine dehydrogenase 1